jgi:protein-S-isoprenylcysteine O-methyltransferase Ste14
MGWGRRSGRTYFALQSVGGAAWWLAVAVLPPVRSLTLGTLDPVAVAAFDVPLFVVASALAASGVRWAAVVATGWTVLVLVGLATWATLTGEAGVGVVAMAAAAVGSLLALSLVLLGRVATAWIAVGPFRFRPADPAAPPARHVAGTAAQIVVFWGTLLAVVPVVLALLERRWGIALPVPADVARASTTTGAVVLVLASALGITSAVVMSTRGAGTPLPSAMPNRLVVAGPYRVVRNPMAVAGIAQGVAVGLLLSSWTVVVYAVAGALVWNGLIRPVEEADLERRFGDAFRRYRAAVRCWVPVRPVARS